MQSTTRRKRGLALLLVNILSLTSTANNSFSAFAPVQVFSSSRPCRQTLQTPQVLSLDGRQLEEVITKRRKPKSPESAVEEKTFGCFVDESIRQVKMGDMTVDSLSEDDGPDIAPRSTSPIPHINSPNKFGLRPGSPAQYLIATTGSRPIHFSIVDGKLPAGLQLDNHNGVITGKTKERGAFDLTLMATNRFGVATHPLTIQVGDTIALTPPRGISTWNSCGDQISEDKVRCIVQLAVQLQLRDYGYTYLNIDDGWQGERDADGTPKPNSKFGDMKQLMSDLHAMGLHCGIYGTPWKWSYAFYPGGSTDPEPWLKRKPSFYIPNLFGWRLGQIHYEEKEADYFASIGADFVKWDWYRNDLASTRRMAKALKRQPRDIVYSLSNSAPLRNAPEYQRLSHMVRTTADIRDAWDSHSPRDAFCLGIREIWKIHERWAKFCGSGHFTDPDMLVIGPVGWGCRGGTNDKVDEKTLDILCNRGALEINQDGLGRQGETVFQEGNSVVVSKPLENGDLTVGLFNTGRGHRQVSVTWEQLGLSEKMVRSVHDVWANKDLLEIDTKGLQWDVREHSAKLFRISTKAM